MVSKHLMKQCCFTWVYRDSMIVVIYGEEQDTKDDAAKMKNTSLVDAHTSGVILKYSLTNITQHRPTISTEENGAW